MRRPGRVMVAVDGSSLFMRALSVLPPDKRRPEDLLYMVVGMLRKAGRYVGATDLAVMLDTYDTPCWRLTHHPGYKGDRDRNGLQPRQLTPILRPLLEGRGIPVGHLEGYEADDLLKAVAVRVKPTTELFIYTKDSDLYSALGAGHPHVRLLWPDNGGKLRVITHREAEEHLGHLPALLPSVRALTADTKDNLRGLFGDPPPKRAPINKPRAVHLLGTASNDLQAVLSRAESGFGTATWREKEVVWVRENRAPITAAWFVATQVDDAMPPLNPAACAIARMDLSLPDTREQ